MGVGAEVERPALLVPFGAQGVAGRAGARYANVGQGPAAMRVARPRAPPRGGPVLHLAVPLPPLLLGPAPPLEHAVLHRAGVPSDMAVTRPSDAATRRGLLRPVRAPPVVALCHGRPTSAHVPGLAAARAGPTRPPKGATAPHGKARATGAALLAPAHPAPRTVIIDAPRHVGRTSAPRVHITRAPALNQKIPSDHLVEGADGSLSSPATHLAVYCANTGTYSNDRRA